MTNSQLLLDESRLLARKLSSRLPAAQKDDAASESAFIKAAFEQVLSRRPSRQEQAACSEFLLKQKELFHRIKFQPAKDDGSIAPSLEPGMRARESLVRALFSHDDFVTIR